MVGDEKWVAAVERDEVVDADAFPRFVVVVTAVELRSSLRGE